MTPLARALAKIVPPKLLWLALTLCYALALFSVIVLGGQSATDIIYIDIEETK